MNKFKKLIPAYIAGILIFLPVSFLSGNEDKYLSPKYEGYNLIMISINNIGTEHMSLYGYERKTTPYLDKWSQEALVFEDAFSPSSWTLPVATSVFTSLYPYTHKVMNRYHGNLLDKEIITLPRVLRVNNYKTAAFTGGLDYKSFFGHMKGFEVTDNNDNFSKFQVILPQAKKWLAKNSRSRFFLFIHGYDAHPPFDPPKRFEGIFSNTKGKKITIDHRFTLRGFKNSGEGYTAYYIKHDNPSLANMELPEKKEAQLTQDDIDYLRDLYDEQVMSVDSMIGKFLNSLSKKILDKTIIVIFSEHGEMFAKHGRFGRAGAIRGTFYDEVVHVPLIIKIPHFRGKRIQGLTQLIDILPTLLDILNIPYFEKIQGKSLLPLVNGSESVNDYIYGGTIYNKERPEPYSYYKVQSFNEYVRDNKWKLIHEVNLTNDDKENLKNKAGNEKETFELYDIEDDPQEYNNLAEKYPAILKDLKEKLSKWAQLSQNYLPVYLSSKEIPKSLIEDARKHGYW